MENIAIFLLIVLFFLLCVAAVLLIIKIFKTKSDFAFYFKKSTRLYELAFKDDLTDLYNRNAYIRDLRKLERTKLKSLWFSIFDIDDFKKINDLNGHLTGDEILISAAGRLGEIFSDKNHTIYRIGGDEFFVISKDISEDDLVKLLKNLENTELEKNDFRFSKGYSFVQNGGIEQLDAAFDTADKMLYSDKNSKRH